MTTTKAIRERLVSTMFELKEVPAFFLAREAVLSCFAAGREKGLVLDCGATSTVACCVHDGFALRKSKPWHIHIHKFLSEDIEGICPFDSFLSLLSKFCFSNFCLFFFVLFFAFLSDRNFVDSMDYFNSCSVQLHTCSVSFNIVLKTQTNNIGIKTSPLAGNMISRAIVDVAKAKNVALRPRYMIKRTETTPGNWHCCRRQFFPFCFVRVFIVVFHARWICSWTVGVASDIVVS